MRVGLAAVAAVGIVVASCEVESGRGTGVGAADDPCDFDPDILLACSDESCDLEALEQQLAACSVDDKADTNGDSYEEWMDRIQQMLAERAAACYAAGDTDCLKGVYFSLAAGAKVKGLTNAADMMLNFLNCTEDPAEVGADAVRSDESVVEVTDVMRIESWKVSEQQAISLTSGDIELAIEKVGVTATSPDIYYAMGSFHVGGTAIATIADGQLEQVELRLEATDRYDWHPGAEAGGSAIGIGQFKDDWAQFLVDEGVACEFDMISRWTDTVTEAPENDAPPPSNGDGSGGDCCDVHESKGCEIGECSAVVCNEDPYCCDVEWEGLCVARAASHAVCGCSDGGETGGGTDTGGDVDGGDVDGGEVDDGGATSGGQGGTCVGNCGMEFPVDCGCDPTCNDFDDCCPDYAALCE